MGRRPFRCHLSEAFDVNLQLIHILYMDDLPIGTYFIFIIFVIFSLFDIPFIDLLKYCYFSNEDEEMGR